MVSTRRSQLSAGGDSEQAAPVNASQDDAVSSKHRVLQPITEEDQQQQQKQQQPAATPRGCRSSRRVASQQQQQLTQEQQQQQDPEPVQQHQQQQQQQEQQYDGGGAASSSDDEDSGDDDAGLDFDFDGDGVLQNLAAAIRSGFHSQRPQQPHQQPRTGLQAAAAAAAAARKSSSSGARELDDAELQQLRWRPDTGLQMPARAAAAVAITKPRQKKRQQDGVDEQQPVGAAAAAAGPQQPDPAAAAAASKQPGLAKALHAPSLDAAARGKEAKKSAPDTAGSKWFDLPAPKITEDLKRDLRLLRLRGAYDPKRFYKSFDNSKFPKYFAVSSSS
jgi:hypothetical protein